MSPSQHNRKHVENSQHTLTSVGKVPAFHVCQSLGSFGLFFRYVWQGLLMLHLKQLSNVVVDLFILRSSSIDFGHRFDLARRECASIDTVPPVHERDLRIQEFMNHGDCPNHIVARTAI